MKKNPISFPLLWALLGGLVLPFGFAPYNNHLVPYVSCVLLLHSLKHLPWKKASILGFVYGLAFFGTGVSWVYVSIHEYGSAPIWLAVLITSLFIAILSIFPSILAAGLNGLFPQENAQRWLIGFPLLWVGLELLRGILFTGFPWLFLGYTQLHSPIAHFAPLAGVFGVSLFTVWVSGCLYGFFRTRQPRFVAYLGIFFVIALGAGHMTWTQPSDKSLSVALIQGNIPQQLRWQPNYLDSIMDTYHTLTEKALGADLIVWPEGAIPLPLPASAKWLDELGQWAASHNSALITGIPVRTSHGQYYNALVGVGLAQGTYYKTHLVPFGEYVPFENTLRGVIDFFDLPMSDFVIGPPGPPAILKIKTVHIAPAICYEIAYPFYVQKVSNSADFILTVSNDTWFGTSIGPHQHLQIAQFRALETGKPVIRATNTGLTALILPNGDIQQQAPSFESTVLRGSLPIMVGQTPWVQWGGSILVGIFSIFIMMALYNKIIKREACENRRTLPA